MDNTIQLVFFILVIIPSAILHEYAHGVVADSLGDPTPRLAGRLTLNPIPHIDIWGTIILPFTLFFLTAGNFLFAYAKPVPFNPLALRSMRLGPGLVAAAGPLANLLVAFVLGLLVRYMSVSPFTNLLEIIVYANIILAVFNLVPIPPLDGSKVLFTLLPDSFFNLKLWLDRYGIILLLVLLPMVSRWISPIVAALFGLTTGGRHLFSP